MPDLEKARRKIDEIDTQIAKLFEKRMTAVGEIFEYKKEHGMKIYDQSREEEILKKKAEMIEDDSIKKYYSEFQKSVMDISKKYQFDLQNEFGNIHIGCEILKNIEEYINLDRKIMIVTDNNIPNDYIKAVSEKCKMPYVFQMSAGEKSKTVKTFEEILSKMLENRFTRKDAVVAIGGGIVGDVAGFCASCYMRGVDFYNIPTSLLAQVDACVGGKTAVNFNGIKNIVGSFYRPKAVVIDTATLQTLPKREFSSGMAEVVKMAATLDAELFEHLENEEFDIEYVIRRAIKNKMNVVLQDEYESDLRRVLNFGHTIGHAVEALGKYNHGESVAVGMLPMCSTTVRGRIERLLKSFDLPTKCSADANEIFDIALNDKKSAGDGIIAVFVDEIGTFRFEKIGEERLKELICEVLE